jgi:hypothetical protein
MRPAARERRRSSSSSRAQWPVTRGRRGADEPANAFEVMRGVDELRSTHLPIAQGFRPGARWTGRVKGVGR